MPRAHSVATVAAWSCIFAALVICARSCSEGSGEAVIPAKSAVSDPARRQPDTGGHYEHPADSPEEWAHHLRSDATIPAGLTLEGMERLPWDPIGDLPDDHLSFMLEGLASLHRQSTEARRQLVASSADSLYSFELADIDFDIEGYDAKSNALLAGSYVLVPDGHRLPNAICDKPYLHVVIAPGGEKWGTKFTTYILIDLRKYGKFAEAMRIRGVRKREVEDKLLSRFMQFSQRDRDSVTQKDEGPRELLEIWAEMRRRGVVPR